MAERGPAERFVEDESKARGSSKLGAEDFVLVGEGGVGAEAVDMRDDEVEGASSAAHGLLITDDCADALPPLLNSFAPSFLPNALQLLPPDDSPFCVLEWPDSEVGEAACCCWDSA